MIIQMTRKVRKRSQKVEVITHLMEASQRKRSLKTKFPTIIQTIPSPKTSQLFLTIMKTSLLKI